MKEIVTAVVVWIIGMLILNLTKTPCEDITSAQKIKNFETLYNLKPNSEVNKAILKTELYIKNNQVPIDSIK